MYKKTHLATYMREVYDLQGGGGAEDDMHYFWAVDFMPEKCYACIAI